MDRTQRWGNQTEQRQERERYRKPPQHAHVPLRVLRCADCWEELLAIVELEGRVIGGGRACVRTGMAGCVRRCAGSRIVFRILRWWRW